MRTWNRGQKCVEWLFLFKHAWLLPGLTLFRAFFNSIQAIIWVERLSGLRQLNMGIRYKTRLGLHGGFIRLTLVPEIPIHDQRENTSIMKILLKNHCGITLCTILAVVCFANNISVARQDLAGQRSAQVLSEAISGQTKQKSINDSHASLNECPNPSAIDNFKYDLAYEKKDSRHPDWGLQKLDIEVWQRGLLTGFYVRNKVIVANPNLDIRNARIYDTQNNQRSGGYCPAEKNWIECIEGLVFDKDKHSAGPVQTCTAKIDLRTLLHWKPSPNDSVKQRLARELRKEIEAEWPVVVGGIVVHDFNMRDHEIIVCLETSEGDEFEKYTFSAERKPHLKPLGGFGTISRKVIKSEIFSMPYRLK
jgi:hypothetical protein